MKNLEKYFSEKYLGLSFTVFALGYGMLNCDAQGFCSGILTGAAAMVTLAMWLEDGDTDEVDAEPRR